MKQCPDCQSTDKQHKAGFTEAGSQRYRCMTCGKKYTPEPKTKGYSAEVRQRAVEWYRADKSLRRIGHRLGVSPQSVLNWVRAQVAHRPAAPQPEQVQRVEPGE